MVEDLDDPADPPFKRVAALDDANPPCRRNPFHLVAVRHAPSPPLPIDHHFRPARPRPQAGLARRSLNPYGKGMTKDLHQVLTACIEGLSSDNEFFGPSGPCPVAVERPAGAPMVALVTGENGGGKSFLVKVLCSRMYHGHDVLGMDIGMSRRTEGGIQRAMIFGAGGDSDNSTGLITAAAALAGIRNSTGRDGPPRMLLLDEPDIGLSETFADALGRRLASFCGDLPLDCAGVVVVTHNRMIASRLAAIGPWMLRVGPDLRPTSEWLRNGPLPVDDGAIEDLISGARQRRSDIQAILDRRVAENNDAFARKRAAVDARLLEATRSWRAARDPSVTDVDAKAAAGTYVAAWLDRQAVLLAKRDAGFSFCDGMLRYLDTDLAAATFVDSASRTRLRMLAIKVDGLTDERGIRLSDEAGLEKLWHSVKPMMAKGPAQAAATSSPR